MGVYVNQQIPKRSPSPHPALSPEGRGSSTALLAPSDDKHRDLPKSIGFGAERLEGGNRPFAHRLGLFSGGIDSDLARIGPFSTGGIGAGRLACFGRLAFDIEEVIGDLKRQPHRLAVARQRRQFFRATPANIPPIRTALQMRSPVLCRWMS